MLGHYLKVYRLNNNLTQKEMAEKIGTSQTYYCLIETGRCKPGIRMIQKIAQALNVTPIVIRNML